MVFLKTKVRAKAPITYFGQNGGVFETTRSRSVLMKLGLTYKISVLETVDRFLLQLRNLKVTPYSGAKRRFVVVVVLLFYVHGKHLRSCRDGQLT